MKLFKFFSFLLLLPCYLLSMNSDTSTFSLEWIDVTPQNISTMEPIFRKLEPVSRAAFKEIEIKLLVEQTKIEEDKAREMVEEKARSSSWERFPEFLGMLFKEGLEKVPFAIIKNSQSDILGFAYFLLIPQKTMLETGNVKEMHWLKEGRKVATPDSEAYVASIAVDPKYQGYGFGKKLLFSILSYMPQIQKITLSTWASQLNQKTQNFYKHCGFECIAAYLNDDDEERFMYEFNR